jgi:hypothetical protein
MLSDDPTWRPVAEDQVMERPLRTPPSRPPVATSLCGVPLHCSVSDSVLRASCFASLRDPSLRPLLRFGFRISRPAGASDSSPFGKGGPRGISGLLIAYCRLPALRAAPYSALSSSCSHATLRRVPPPVPFRISSFVLGVSRVSGFRISSFVLRVSRVSGFRISRPAGASDSSPFGKGGPRGISGLPIAYCRLPASRAAPHSNIPSSCRHATLRRALPSPRFGFRASCFEFPA